MGSGAPGAVAGAARRAYERWDGLGIPNGRAGDQLDPVARVVHVAEQIVLAHFSGGEAAARKEVARRAGGQLDPDLCVEFARHSDQVLGALEAPDMLAAVLAAKALPTHRQPLDKAALQDLEHHQQWHHGNCQTGKEQGLIGRVTNTD